MPFINRPLSPQTASALRIIVFIVATTFVWGVYFWWRPPGPLLGLRVVNHMPEDSNKIALTFDDGPHPLTTPLLLASLRRANVKATFFVVGEGMKQYPQLALRIKQEGHSFGNHSQNHHNLTRLSPDEYPVEVDDGFSAITGIGAQSSLFRPPGGGLNHATIDYLYRDSKTLGWWSNNVGDWMPMEAWRIALHMNASMRSGDIVLMHDAGTSTAQALPVIVREARKRGLEFVPMPEATTY